MTFFRLGRHFRRGTLALVAGLATTAGFAQDDESSRSTDLEVPAVQADAEPVRQDSIDAYQVRLAETDYLAGRLQVVDPISGEIRGVRKTNLTIVQAGKVVGRAQTGVGGVAQIRSLPIGDYSIVAIGPDGMAAFGFEVLPMASGVAVSSYRFDGLMVPAPDVSVVQRGLCTGTAPLPSTGPLTPIPVALERQVEESVTSTAVADVDAFAGQPVSAPLKGQPIFIQSGEAGVGQIVVFNGPTGAPIGLTNARLSFIRSGQVLGTVETDDEGHCSVIGLEDGIYSMVGVGSEGFIALGVRVETSASPLTAESATEDESLVSSLQVGGPNVGWRVCGAHATALPYAPGFGCGSCGKPGCCGQCGLNVCDSCDGAFGPGGFGAGGFGGGGFGAGGGGFGGGGGLLGALVGAGVGAGIGAALANDDDDGGQIIIVSPSSPPSP